MKKIGFLVFVIVLIFIEANVCSFENIKAVKRFEWIPEWEYRTSDLPGSWRGLRLENQYVYGKNTLLINYGRAVAGFSENKTMKVTYKCKTWQTINKIGYLNDMFVLFGEEGRENNQRGLILSSGDGFEWIEADIKHESTQAFSWKDFAYGNETYCITRRVSKKEGYSIQILVSKDAQNWHVKKEINIEKYSWHPDPEMIFYQDQFYLFVNMPTDEIVLLRSNDGNEWIEEEVGTQQFINNLVIMDKRLFNLTHEVVSTFEWQYTVNSSADGKTWSSHGFPSKFTKREYILTDYTSSSKELFMFGGSYFNPKGRYFTDNKQLGFLIFSKDGKEWMEAKIPQCYTVLGFISENNNNFLFTINKIPKKKRRIFNLKCWRGIDLNEVKR